MFRPQGQGKVRYDPLMPNDRPPSILFLMSDEHRADVAGFAGNRVVRTPFLDVLSRTGVTFEKAYCPSPICVPCRQAMACGQRPRTCGVERYGQDLPPFSMTFARQLARYGYTTACAGKLHHMGPDQMQGWTHRMGLDLTIGTAYRDLKVEPGDAFGHGRSDGKWSDAKEIKRAGVGRGPATQATDEAALHDALRFVDHYFADPYYDRPAAPTPLLFKLSFVRPHYPYFTTEQLFTYYLNRVPVYLDEPVFDHAFLRQHAVGVGPGGQVTERELRRATAAYYGMIEEIDTDYARLVQRLEHLGEDLDDWWVVYTSDHGEMLGEHGIWEKQKFFEASVRVPLLIRPPRALREQWGCTGRRVSANVSLLDLFATLCHAASVPLPDAAETVNGAGLESRSLLPLMRGEGAGDALPGDDEVTSEFGGVNLMIKRGPLKYQWYGESACGGHREVLFDLEADPSERRNLIAVPRYATALPQFRTRRDALGFAPPAGSKP